MEKGKYNVDGESALPRRVSKSLLPSLTLVLGLRTYPFDIDTLKHV